MGQNSTEVAYGFGQMGSVFTNLAFPVYPPKDHVIVAIQFLQTGNEVAVLETETLDTMGPQFPTHQDDEIFENIKTKTLVMTGENDIGSTPEMSQNLSKKIANSKVKIISNGKHLCSIECADDVNNAIKEHIKND